ncbi:DNA internalization-related competence protein ComEC/Rec2 [Nitrincola sp.]|uniref:DNA internalization-related competence protein ComEC/Rec2 n=1 Tax=Nitrincola sp. TaxID=1926584 RepID=UPI003A8E4CB5
MIAYLFGLLIVSFLPRLSLVWLFVLLLPCCWIYPLRRLALYFFAGVLVAAVYGAWQLQHRLPASWDSSDAVFTGVVTDLPEYNDRRTRFILSVQSGTSADPALQRLRSIRVNYYYQPDEQIKVIAAGDLLTLRLKLRTPHFLQNPDAFDLELHFLRSGWDASATLLDVIEHQPNYDQFQSLREHFRTYLRREFAATEAAWLLPAILLGDRSAMTDEHWQVLQKTGTAHLLVVSGLHIAVVAGVGLLSGRVFSGLLLLVGLRHRSLRVLPLLLALLLATGYAVLAGFNLPVQRAWLMVCVFLAGEWRLLQFSGWLRWRIALIVIVTLQPLAVIQPGAWMSFAAVALLLFLSDCHRTRHKMWFGQLLRAQWVIFIGMIPVMAVVFQQLGLAAPLINFFAVPVFSLFIMLLPAFLLGVFLEWNWVTAVLVFFLDGFWFVLQHLEQLPGGHHSLAKPSIILVLLLVPLLSALLAPVPWRWKGIALLLFVPLVWPPKDNPSDGDFRAIVFDVGQGLGVLIETQEHLLMYDTGPGYFGGGSAWSYAIEPWFKSRNLGYLDHLVVSHNDLDHAGGLSALKANLVVRRQETGSLQLQPDFLSCHQHQSWQYDGVSFRYLTDRPADTANENDHSCVLEVRNTDCSLLLPGDIRVATEYDLIRSRRLEPVTWLVAAHHGSNSSSSEAFIDRLQPDTVIYAAGYNNRYGHPVAEVSERFARRGIQAYNTAEVGAITLYANAGQCQESVQRQQKRRYWTNG